MSEEEARALAHRLLEGTGYPCPELSVEPLEHGWKLSAGEDVGAVRITYDHLALHRVHLEVLKMWWTASAGPWRDAWEWLAGQPDERPGGHLLWTTVLKARSVQEMDAALAHASEMRLAMLARAGRRGLQPTSCRLFHFFANRLSGEGDAPGGVRWWAEARHGVIRSMGDSSPLWVRLTRRWRRPSQDVPSPD
jgi:hypothetical protein